MPPQHPALPDPHAPDSQASQRNTTAACAIARTQNTAQRRFRRRVMETPAHSPGVSSMACFAKVGSHPQQIDYSCCREALSIVIGGRFARQACGPDCLSAAKWVHRPWIRLRHGRANLVPPDGQPPGEFGGSLRACCGQVVSFAGPLPGPTVVSADVAKPWAGIAPASPRCHLPNTLVA